MPEPRHNPNYKVTNNEEFLGYAGELDVWIEDRSRDESKDYLVLLIAPQERLPNYPDRYYNFDGYEVTEDGRLESQEPTDVHVELQEMCEVYRLCVARGILEEPT